MAKKNSADKDKFPSTIDCHCMHEAHSYTSRTFTNSLNHVVVRVFYRCVNCWSRIHIDYNEELDKSNVIDVCDLAAGNYDKSNFNVLK